MSKRVSNQDLQFMSSLSQAALEKPTRASRIMVWVILLVVAWLLVWANMAELDKIVRGEGKVVPSSRIQVVQNYEGGIVERLFFQEGDLVAQGDVLLQLDNTQFASSFGEKTLELLALRAKSLRLEAESEVARRLSLPVNFDSVFEQQVYEREQALFQNRQRQLQSSLEIVREQQIQHRTELDNAFEQEKQLARSHNLLNQEIEMMRPLVRQGIAPEIDMLRLQREANDTFGKLNAVRQSIPRYESLIKESASRLDEIQQKFSNEAKEDLNFTLAQISQLESVQVALEDKVVRTAIRAPVGGVISELLVSSLGEVVQPGSDIVKIVPVDDFLVLETKIQPSDIGFIYSGLKARVRFTAYDFSIYGALDGYVERVSADTVTDDQGNSYYVARIRTHKNYLGQESAPLPLMAGMVASVDVIVGKQTVLDYLMKPILKTKDTALRES
ncbi:HlyD family type I secretion periplasmic adaptor subunit [Thiomicrospira microaerophila]|uniref:HlyD family type I secretion periplasmic adaptor subunit n=1 Tax=Thiomicrospira microaerophila TaxID=406020 RepID=UPI0005CAEE1C|nr:HlyD family type I secretion periplasmic adaptor subunit [Thiomicrospira microaerophila]